jgi:mRNA interferase MazF
MSGWSRGDVVLVRYPFSDLSSTEAHPALVAGAPHSSRDLIVVPLNSRASGLLAGEFALADWAAAGRNVLTAVKRGLYTFHERLVLRTVGRLNTGSMQRVAESLRMWLGLA